MKIFSKWLYERSACVDGYIWFNRTFRVGFSTESGAHIKRFLQDNETRYWLCDLLVVLISDTNCFAGCRIVEPTALYGSPSNVFMYDRYWRKPVLRELYHYLDRSSYKLLHERLFHLSNKRLIEAAKQIGRAHVVTYRD